MRKILTFFASVVAFCATTALAQAAPCSPSHTFVTGETLTAVVLNSNPVTFSGCFANIDDTNIGAAGIYASQLNPGNNTQATFGGGQSYTFPVNLTVTGSTTTAGLTNSGSTSTAGLSNSANEVITGTLGVTGASTLTSLSATNGTFSGTLGVTGASTLGTLSATNGTLSGTLGVTGATTLGAVSTTGVTNSGNETVTGTLGVTGASTLHALSTTGVTNSGNESISGTLGVTGATTMAAVSGTTGNFSTSVTSPTGNITSVSATSATLLSNGTVSQAFPVFINGGSVFGQSKAHEEYIHVTGGAGTYNFTAGGFDSTPVCTSTLVTSVSATQYTVSGNGSFACAGA